MDGLSVRQLLTRRGLRCTVQREQIYAALLASKTHPTAEELHGLVKSQVSDTLPGAAGAGGGGPSLATVYNTLEALTEAGLVRRIAPACGGSAAAFRYDADCSNHAHLVAADGSVRDLPEDLCRRVVQSVPPELIAEVERAMGVRVGRIGVEFVQARTEAEGGA
jgi:Fe2+ or Zn2+ uptake regulation protein